MTTQLRHDETRQASFFPRSTYRPPPPPRFALWVVATAAAASMLAGVFVGYKAGRERPVAPGFTCPGGVIPADEVRAWSFNRPGLTLFDSGVWYQDGVPFGYSEPGGDVCVFGGAR